MTPSLSEGASRASAPPTVRDKRRTARPPSWCHPSVRLSSYLSVYSALMAGFSACRRCPPRSPLRVSPLCPARASSPLCTQPSSRFILGCQSPVRFSRVWWESCPPTESGTLQLGRRGSCRPPRRVSAPPNETPPVYSAGPTICLLFFFL